jgi:protein ImuB
MSRIVSVWLPRWPILRFLAAQTRHPLPPRPVDPERPFVLAVDATGGPHVAAANEAAEASGIRVGDSLADARAKAGFLQVEAADPASDAVALEHLALWATRYTPAVSPFDEESGADGFFLDISGSSHLFGGEERLIDDLSQRLGRFGLKPRLAVADTPGMAWAFSRFHPSPGTILPLGKEAKVLENKTFMALPIGALRLAPATRRTLRRLGFKRVGALIGAPRAPFAARFEAELLKRLDQALGRAPEPLVFIAPSPAYRKLIRLIEPILTQDAVIALTERLMKGLVGVLQRDGMGARCLRLTLYRVDGEVTTLDIGLAMPTRDFEHVARLIALKLERRSQSCGQAFSDKWEPFVGVGPLEHFQAKRMPHRAKRMGRAKERGYPHRSIERGKTLEKAIDAGFGFEAVSLDITVAERMEPRQIGLVGVTDDADRAARCAALIDGLRQRLGPRSVRRLEPVASHLPEKAEASLAATHEAPVWPRLDRARLRPPLLLRHAEPTEVVALMPEGAPRRFRWRGVTHGVALAQGPERIAATWWRERKPQPTRDYYFVENEAGRRFWLYREGLYGRETVSPRWFVHGFFA